VPSASEFGSSVFRSGCRLSAGVISERGLEYSTFKPISGKERQLHADSQARSWRNRISDTPDFLISYEFASVLLSVLILFPQILCPFAMQILVLNRLRKLRFLTFCTDIYISTDHGSSCCCYSALIFLSLDRILQIHFALFMSTYLSSLDFFL
jgi:hypothetical protein